MIINHSVINFFIVQSRNNAQCNVTIFRMKTYFAIKKEIYQLYYFYLILKFLTKLINKLTTITFAQKTLNIIYQQFFWSDISNLDASIL